MCCYTGYNSANLTQGGETGVCAAVSVRQPLSQQLLSIIKDGLRKALSDHVWQRLMRKVVPSGVVASVALELAFAA